MIAFFGHELVESSTRVDDDGAPWIEQVRLDRATKQYYRLTFKLETGYRFSRPGHLSDFVGG